MSRIQVALRTAGELVRDSGLTVPRTRSPKWATVREAHLKVNPACRACGQRDKLNVHHIRPFHLFPELELEPTNLVTLCEDGPSNLNCHLVFGHGGNWTWYNPRVLEISSFVSAMIDGCIKPPKIPPTEETNNVVV